MSLPPHGFWQEIHPAGALCGPSPDSYGTVYPARLPDGREIAFPVRVLPGGNDRAVASLILNQAGFAVEDALCDAVAAAARAFAPDILVGVPTLGLGLANGVARRLGHARLVPLGTSRKFWYEEGLSVPVRSITSPDQDKRLWLDPRMLPLLAGRRVAVVDDAVSSGRTLLAVLALMDRAGVAPVAGLFAMIQGRRWETALAGAGRGGLPVAGAVETPLLARVPGSDPPRWRPDGA